MKKSRYNTARRLLIFWTLFIEIGRKHIELNTYPEHKRYSENSSANNSRFLLSYEKICRRDIRYSVHANKRKPRKQKVFEAAEQFAQGGAHAVVAQAAGVVGGGDEAVARYGSLQQVQRRRDGRLYPHRRGPGQGLRHHPQFSRQRVSVSEPGLLIITFVALTMTVPPTLIFVTTLTKYWALVNNGKQNFTFFLEKFHGI